LGVLSYNVVDSIEDLEQNTSLKFQTLEFSNFDLPNLLSMESHISSVSKNIIMEADCEDTNNMVAYPPK
jgi:hypothetical protein